MNGRILAIFALALMVISGITVALIHINDNGDDERTIYDTWYATYIESFDSDTREISSEDYPIEDRYKPLIIEKCEKGFFIGEWGGIEIQGTLTDDVLIFESFSYPFVDDRSCYVEARYIEDRILFSIMLFDNEFMDTVGAAHVQYTRHDKSPAIGVDTVDFERGYTPGTSWTYTEDSILGAHDSMNGDTSPELSFVDSGTMINILETNEGSTMVLISVGYDRSGRASAFLMGSCTLEGTAQYYCGMATMSDNRFVISYETDNSEGTPYVVWSEYSVNYSSEGYKAHDIENVSIKDLKVSGILEDGSPYDMTFDLSITVKGVGINISFTDTSNRILMSFIGTINGNCIQGVMSTPVNSGHFVSFIHDGEIRMSGLAYSDGYDIPFCCTIPI